MYGLGRIPSTPDKRDYRMADYARKLTPRQWVDKSVLNQGQTGHCVGFSWAGFGLSTPVVDNWTDDDGHRIYYEAKVIDGEPKQEDGSSVRSGAKALKNDSRIKVYYFASSIQEAAEYVSQFGPVVLGIDWYCTVPGTRVLKTDLTWYPTEKLEVGDEVIGFDECGDRQAKYRRSVVNGTRMVVQPTYEIVTDKGTIVTSAGHGFIKTHPKAKREWVVASELKPGDCLVFMGEPWETDESREAGWLAGFYDGEGSLAAWDEKPTCNLLDCSQKPGKPGAIEEYAMALLKAKGFDYSVNANRATAVVRWHLRGPNVKLRFLGSIRPKRLLAISHNAWEGHATWNNNAPAATVQEVRHIGDEEVVGISTSTKTLVTDGFLSHNSDMFSPVSGIIRPGGGVAGGHAILWYGVDSEYATLRNSWGAGWGRGGDCRISLKDLASIFVDNGEACAATELPLGKKPCILKRIFGRSSK